MCKRIANTSRRESIFSLGKTLAHEGQFLSFFGTLGLICFATTIGGGLGEFAPRLFRSGQPPVAAAPVQALLAISAPAIVVSLEHRDAASGFLRQSMRDGIETWFSFDNVALYLEPDFWWARGGWVQI